MRKFQKTSGKYDLISTRSLNRTRQGGIGRLAEEFHEAGTVIVKKTGAGKGSTRRRERCFLQKTAQPSKRRRPGPASANLPEKEQERAHPYKTKRIKKKQGRERKEGGRQCRRRSRRKKKGGGDVGALCGKKSPKGQGGRKTLRRNGKREGGCSKAATLVKLVERVFFKTRRVKLFCQ